MVKKNVLVVVDWQKGFVDGSLGFNGADRLDGGILDLVKSTLEDPNGIVICTYDTHFESTYMQTQEGRLLPVMHCSRLSDDWQLYGEVGELIKELNAGVHLIKGKEYGDGNTVVKVDTQGRYDNKVYLVEKPTFPSLNLGNLLYDLDHADGDNCIDKITFCGLVTNMCVMSNACIAKAACPEAEIIIEKNNVDSFDKELHQKALDVMESMQMTVK